ncbi:MAG: LemA family protein [Campylobacterales bacterium]|nr:LemA family protein [Campylobacterales bacterium]
MTVWIVLGVLAFVLMLMYNTLISHKNQVENIFASVDTVLKKRYDLIPNLVASVQQYMSHEKELLEKITQWRSLAMKPGVSDEQKISLDKQVTGALGSIMVAVENYPDLKANENVMHLQRTLLELEEQISAARRAYNQAVTDYNNIIEMFPTNFMANLMRYSRKAVFETAEHERKTVDVKVLFKS